MAQFLNPLGNYWGAFVRLFSYYYEPSTAFPPLLSRPSGEKHTSLPCVMCVLQSKEPLTESGKVKGDAFFMYALL